MRSVSCKARQRTTVGGPRCEVTASVQRAHTQSKARERLEDAHGSDVVALHARAVLRHGAGAWRDDVLVHAARGHGSLDALADGLVGLPMSLLVLAAAVPRAAAAGAHREARPRLAHRARGHRLRCEVSGGCARKKTGFRTLSWPVCHEPRPRSHSPTTPHTAHTQCSYQRSAVHPLPVHSSMGCTPRYTTRRRCAPSPSFTSTPMRGARCVSIFLVRDLTHFAPLMI